MSLCLALLAATLVAPQGASYAKPTPIAIKVSVFGKASATLRVPHLETRAPLCDLAEKVVGGFERQFVSNWVKENRPILREFPDHAKHVYFQSVTDLKFDDPKALSFKSLVEYYNGVAAHGMTHRRTYNFGFVAGKPARFGVGEAMLRDKASRVALQELLVGRAGQMEGTHWIAEGTVKYLSDQQLDRFWVDKDALVWEFDPYELGPYSSGGFTVRIPRMDLAALIRPDGPLGFWAARSV